MNKRILSAALAALAFPGSAVAATVPPLPDADPAMWRVKDKDTTIYLFGTFHALDGKAEWFNDEVKTAFDKSDELVLEALIPEDPAALAPVVMKYAMDNSGKTLTSRLSPEGQKKFSATLTGLGVPPTGFDKFRPWFASMTLTMIGMQKLGISPDKGTEVVLRQAAKTAGKPVGELENVEYQMAMFNRISEADQVKMLEDMLGSMDQIPVETKRMLTAWNKGDAAGFRAIMAGNDSEGPAAHKVIFTDRNANWAEWIDKRLDRPGTVFLAVGTGHLSGKDSVQRLLAKRGIRARRVH